MKGTQEYRRPWQNILIEIPSNFYGKHSPPFPDHIEFITPVMKIKESTKKTILKRILLYEFKIINNESFYVVSVNSI